MSGLTLLSGSASAAADDDVLSVLSHELRTPLTILTGLHDLLTEGAGDRLSPDQRAYLATIGTTIGHLSELVTDVLDASALRSHMPALLREPLVLETVIADVMSLHSSSAGRDNVGLLARVPYPLPTICADEDRVAQVLSRLVTNAMAFTREGSDVTIHATSTANTILIGVEDFGPGIRKDDVARLFKPFSQLDMSTTRAHPGLGVGLFLCKRWVEAHGGHIGVVSTHGRGSTFWFTLPCAAA